MARTCEDCGEEFDTLSRLRLHDCPGPDPESNAFIDRVTEELMDGLQRGAILSTLPTDPLTSDLLDRLEEAEPVHTVLTLLSGLEKPGAVERIAIQTTEYGYLLEYFPEDGWVVVRQVDGADKSPDELETALMKTVDEWQSTVTEITLGSGSRDEAQKRLQEELNW
ncbi:MAG: hypothetical protein V5A39_04965 [Haloarculaceae archaeon]